MGLEEQGPTSGPPLAEPSEAKSLQVQGDMSTQNPRPSF